MDAHGKIEAGADIIVMHGAPLLHGVEIYRDRPIFFDLGSFIFQLPPTYIYLDEPINWESVVAYVEFEGRALKSVKFRPITQNKITGPTRRSRRANEQSLLADTRPAKACYRRASALYLCEAG